LGSARASRADFGALAEILLIELQSPFGGAPQDVTDAAANDLPASYVNGTVAITPITRPVLTATQINSGLMLSWPVSATGFNLESNTNLTSTNWSPVNATLTTNGANVIATNSIAGAGLYYRLHHP